MTTLTIYKGWTPYRSVIILQQTRKPIKPDHTKQQSTTFSKYRSASLHKWVLSPEDTEGKIIVPAIETKCKIDTGAAVNVMPISSFKKLCPSMFDAKGNALDEFNKDWTNLIAYGGSIIKWFGKRMIKCKWNYQKWVFSFIS